MGGHLYASFIPQGSNLKRHIDISYNKLQLNIELVFLILKFRSLKFKILQTIQILKIKKKKKYPLDIYLFDKIALFCFASLQMILQIHKSIGIVDSR
jgi:hypothetical protein